MLERLWQENESSLRAVVGTVISDSAAIDDVMQEAYLRILRFGFTHLNNGGTDRFMRKVVWSTTIDLYRRRRHSKETVLCPCLPTKSPPSPLATLLRHEEGLLRRRIWDEVEEALQDLPPDLKQAIDCYFDSDERPIREACSRLGLSYSTLRSRMLAAVERIRRRLKRKGLYEPYQQLRGWA